MTAPTINLDGDLDVDTLEAFIIDCLHASEAGEPWPEEDFRDACRIMLASTLVAKGVEYDTACDIVDQMDGQLTVTYEGDDLTLSYEKEQPNDDAI